MDVLTREQIRKSEENAVHSGAFSFMELMKIAGDKASEIILQNTPIANKRVCVVCGNGNNGGDGFVIAQNLKYNGADVTVVLAMGEPSTDSAKHYFSSLSGVNVTDKLTGEFDIIIDAIFGIGLNRAPDGKLQNLINDMNNVSAFKVAVDIPSGIDCDTGKVLGNCFKADLTVTFIALKPCFLLPPASDFVGQVVVCDIGVTPCDFEYKTIEAPIFEDRRHNSHKGSYGTAVMFCGSYGMAGAAILSARACLRSGVGIAKCVIPKSIYDILTCAVPEAVCNIAKQTKNGSFKGNIDIKTPLNKSNVVLVGCGIGNNRHTQKLVKRLVTDSKVPLVIDADGINALVSNINVLKKTNASIIITPHPAEMARLTGKTVGEIEQNRVKFATDFSKEYGCFTVLKGANTIVATPDGQVFFNTCGNAGMATGGSGDVLAGIIVSYLAQGMDILKAVKSAVYIHSATADKVANIKGERALLPSDIIEAL